MSVNMSLPIKFDSNGIELVGIIEMPREPVSRGVVIVVGGPQYRVGSHRQFVILSRYLAQAGYPVLRFDHQGTGDSDGEVVSFEHIGPNIEAAIDQFFQEVGQLEEIIIWGLCDAASAAMMYAYSDRRVAGLVLLNPWVRSEAGLAKAYLGGYYIHRLRSAKFWQELLTGKVDVVPSIMSFFRNLKSASVSNAGDGLHHSSSSQSTKLESYIDEMRDGLRNFSGQVMFILSGNDLTATEFSGLVERDKHWADMLQGDRCTVFEFPDANHTFSSQKWRDKVGSQTELWLKSW